MADNDLTHGSAAGAVAGSAGEVVVADGEASAGPSMEMRLSDALFPLRHDWGMVFGAVHALRRQWDELDGATRELVWDLLEKYLEDMDATFQELFRSSRDLGGPEVD
jgi:hypothetical protein